MRLPKASEKHQWSRRQVVLFCGRSHLNTSIGPLDSCGRCHAVPWTQYTGRPSMAIDGLASLPHTARYRPHSSRSVSSKSSVVSQTPQKNICEDLQDVSFLPLLTPLLRHFVRNKERQPRSIFMIHRRQAHRLVSLSPSPPSTASQRVHKNRVGLMPPCADLTTARALYGHSSIFLLLYFPIGTRTSARFGNSTHALPVRLPGAIYMVNQSPWCNSRHLSMPVMLSRWTSRRSQHLQGLESA